MINRPNEKQSQIAKIMNRKNILLYQENESLRMSMYLMLKQAGYNVLPSSSFKNTVDLLKQLQGSPQNIHLIITDFSFSCSEENEEHDLHDLADFMLPLVVITNSDDEKFTQSCCAEYVSKPLEAQTLMDSVSTALSRQTSLTV